MLLGIKSKKMAFFRHLLVAVVAGLLLLLYWRAHSAWSPDMRLWKSFGSTTFTLLWFTLLIGPAAKLWRPLRRIVTWRRETGVWFALVALVHAYLVWDGWVRWNVWEFLGYQYVAEVDQYLRFEPGFGLANLMGMVALILGLVLAATSFDKAVSFLGISSWKWLHMMSYVIFYLVALHVIYYAFIHYTPSPHRLLLGQSVTYPKNPIAYYYVIMLSSVMLAQLASFVKTVWSQRHAAKR